MAALVSGTSARSFVCAYYVLALGSLDAECVEPWPWHSDRVGGFVSCAAGVTKVRRFTEKFKSLGLCYHCSGFTAAYGGYRHQFPDSCSCSSDLFASRIFITVFGKERTKAIIFPLSILFLTLPIPLFLTESIHLVLRYIATDSVAWLLPFFGVPVYSTGTLLQIPNGSLQVADACSGFSTLYATITVAILTAYFCPVVHRRVLVLLIAVPLAIAVNIIRVLLLTLLVHWIGLDVLATSAHEISGLATFVVALPIVFWLGRPHPVDQGEQ